MRQKWLKVGLMAATAGLAIQADLVSAAEFNMRFGHILSTDTPAHRAAVRMAESVAQCSDGRIDIQIHPAGALGTDTEIVE